MLLNIDYGVKEPSVQVEEVLDITVLPLEEIRKQSTVRQSLVSKNQSIRESVKYSELSQTQRISLRASLLQNLHKVYQNSTMVEDLTIQALNQINMQDITGFREVEELI